MRGGHGGRPFVGFEVVGVAASAALVSGVLSLVGPYLVSLTGALGALALAGWVEARSGSGIRPRVPLGPTAGLALGGLAVGAVVFLLPPAPLERFRGIALALALVPLWWTAPRGSR